MTTRLDYHLTHEDDKLMLEKTQNRYDLMTEERKDYVRKFIVSTNGTCSGRTRLDRHRLWMELLVWDFLRQEEDKCYEIEDYTESEIEDISIVWFFEKWMNDEYYKLNNYAK